MQFDDAPDDMRFAASVAMFGMKLRNSPFIAGTDLQRVQQIANQSLGNDEKGYRAEFTRLVDTFIRLQQRQEP